MRRLAAIFAILFLAACGSPAAPGPTQTGFTFAQPPGEISQPDGTVPPLPPSGHIGVGALLYTGESLTPHLVLSSGQHLRLPSPPSGEGRNGTMLATLSPDGRWLGHRKAGYARDKRYLIRDLNGKHPTMEIQGSPLMWSPEGRFLFMDGPSDSSGYQLIEPASGKMSQVPYAGGLGAIRPGGLLLSPQPAEPGRRELKLSGPGVDVTITFATDHNHECWCPKSYQVSPDGTTIAILLVYQNGLIPGTKEKAKPKSGAQVTVYELTTGKPLRRVELSDPAVRLLADTGKGLLLQRNGPTGVELVRLDIAGGKQETVSRITGLRDFTVAGGVLSGWT